MRREEDRRQKTEDRRQKTEDRRQKTEELPHGATQDDSEARDHNF
jgi:hypothetical protein